MTKYIECELAIAETRKPRITDAEPRKRLANIPAADVRPVVLCKNCRNNRHCMIQDFMEDYGITPEDQNNFFCGYGEREG